MHSRKFLRILLLAVIAVGCAEVQAPPGGQPDKTPPVVDSTVPHTGATGVPTGRHVEIYFSEPVQPGQGRQVFISPHPAEDPELKYHSDRLTIQLPEDYQPNQTYVITLNAAISDLRGNRLDSSLSIAFSTGPTLDSGSLSGVVLQNGAAQPGVLVGLYNAASTTDSVPFDSLFPEYLTATGKNGQFRLQYLPSKEYRLIAFADKNRDDRFNPTREAFAIPDRPIVVDTGRTLDSLVLHMTAADTGKPEILSAVASQSNMVRVRFAREASLDHVKTHLGDIRLIPVADSTTSRPALALGESDQQKASAVSLYFGPIPEGAYRVHLQLQPESGAQRSGEFTARGGNDTEPPSILRHTPPAKSFFVSDIQIMLAFSEPIDTARLTAQTVTLSRGADTLIPSRIQWSDPMHLQVIPDTLSAGARYLVNITEFEIFDLAGNALGDSLTSFQFSTLNNDSLGTISGTVEVALADRANDPVIIVLKEAQSRFLDTLAVQGGEFRLDVPAGRYILSGFIDSDNDGQFTYGTAVPYRLAETTALYRDTIAVRARFETAEVTFRIK